MVTAQTSFLVAVMYYLGAVYMTSYYRYFRLDAFSLGFSFAELSIQSLSVVTVPVAISLTVTVLVARHLATRGTASVQGRAALVMERWARGVARAHLWFVLAGLLLLPWWSLIQPYGWTAPLLMGFGIFLGQTSWSGAAPASATLWSKAVPVFSAGLLVMWAFSLATDQMGEQEAGQVADNLVRRTAVVVLSTDRLSLAGPGVNVEDLGAKAHYRYRYTGLRRLIERNGRYYLLPLGWSHSVGTTYVVQEGNDVRIDLMPGMQGIRSW
ncbi:hypothetical protein Sgleb_00060 [Streptomyces glebosus]|uniref:Uncharacterized protein n=1 Tax=Streptomyces glebosus TaxID=249580 RepID=A0A640SKJ4_9ACTN|nr:hypothetical protein [Streptomyces glebosus]GFE11959.1 hypothetical protein Sgleb_00060 [Streptomyces glebosus]GHG74617.1 hypothetical protein GCM10010513_48780 [Streptomyces glebosus]